MDGELFTVKVGLNICVLCVNTHTHSVCVCLFLNLSKFNEIYFEIEISKQKLFLN